MHAPRYAALVALAASFGCAPAKGGVASPAAPKVKLTVLPAESYKVPDTAKSITDLLSAAQVAGVDEREVSKVSLEVVQLSIECVEPTVSCYEAVGKQLAANRLLFAQIAAEKKKLKVTITLFDVDARSPKTAQKVFANEKEASAGIADLITEATQ
jgi:hypothetical protein